MRNRKYINEKNNKERITEIGKILKIIKKLQVYLKPSIYAKVIMPLLMQYIYTHVEILRRAKFINTFHIFAPNIAI